MTRHRDGNAGRAAASLLGRVFLRMSLTMFGAIVLIVTVLYVGFASHMDSLRDRSLVGQAADIARHLEADGAGGMRVALPPALEAAYADPSSYRYAVLDPGGELLISSPGVTSALDPEGPLQSGTATRNFAALDAQTGRSFYGASARHTGPAGPVIIQVQQGAEHADVVMDTFLDELGDEVAWIVVLVFAAILLVTWFTLRASLSSLKNVSEQAAAIGPGTLDRRLGLTAVPAEIRPVVQAMNAALDRVEEAFDQQRRFTADAAHEMRTPIAILRAHVDTLDTEAGEELSRDLTTLDRVVGQLLRLAEADSMPLQTGLTADLHQAALNVATLMGPAAIRRGLGIALTGDVQCVVRGDGDAIEMALRNLVENALNHSPDAGEVEIHVDAAHCRVSVLDRGPGIEPERRELVTQRFWRGDRGTSAGAGLGLSIVARIVAAHRATLSIEDRDGGGAAVRMTFLPHGDRSR